MPGMQLRGREISPNDGKTMTNRQIIPTAEPFLLPGTSRIGCILTHGFTATPKDMRWMAEYLNQQGYWALGPRLTGHATQPEDMIRSRYTDWMASLEDAYNLLSGLVEQVWLVGHSMGGALSLLGASYLPVAGVIAIAAPYSLPDDRRLRHIEWLSTTIPYMPKSNDAPDAGWFDKEAFNQHISYPQNPMRSIGELNKMLAEVRAALPKISVPALLVYSRNDHYLPMGSEDSLAYMLAHIGSARKESMMIEGSGHVIPCDAQREIVFKATAEFIKSVK